MTTKVFSVSITGIGGSDEIFGIESYLVLDPNVN